jgi:hypothetical protein
MSNYMRAATEDFGNETEVTVKGAIDKVSNFLFAGIVNGKFEIHVDTPTTVGMETFELDDVAGIAKFIKPFTKTTLATSSSIDYPEDDGAPEGFDARAVLEQALQLV